MIAKFLTDLYESGRIELDAKPAAIGGIEDLQGTLISIDRDVRSDFPGDCPALDPEMAHWATVFLFKACHLLANRDLPAEAVTTELDPFQTPLDRSPATLYSVDLAFRFLPDLERLASQAAADDPLVKALHSQGQLWPLSSVGMPLVSAGLDIAPILANTSLSLLYAERIIERKDKSRLGDPATAALVDEAIGAHPELCPEIAARLAQLRETPLPEAEEKEADTQTL